MVLVESLLRTWCRVNIKRNKTLHQVAEETANLKIIRLLQKFEHTNELVCAAFACDVPLVKAILKSGQYILFYANRMTIHHTSSIPYIYEWAFPLCLSEWSLQYRLPKELSLHWWRMLADIIEMICNSSYFFFFR